MASYAQTEKGNQTLGLNMGFSYNKSNGVSINPYDNSSTDVNSKTTGFNIGPSYSYFIADKLELGASLSYDRDNYNYPNTPGNGEEQLRYDYGGTIYLRKYFMFQNKIGLSAGPYAGYFRGINKLTYEGANSIYSNDSKTDNFEGGLNLGLVYYPTKHLGFSASLATIGYDHNKTDDGTQGHSDGNSFNASFVNNGLSFSIFYVFGN